MINTLTILTWMSKRAYLAPYADDESAKKAATKLWNAIDGSEIMLFILMVVLTCIICLCYFFPFNKKPGRHYHPKWWWLFGVISLVATFVMSYVTCNVMAKNPGFDIGFLFKVSAINTFYAAFIYAIVSMIINRTKKSNAYPYI